MNRTSFVGALEHGLLLIDLAAKVSIDISGVNKKLFFDIKKQLCALLEQLNTGREDALKLGTIRDLGVNDIFKELDAEVMDAFWNEYSKLNEKFKAAGLSPKDINREYSNSHEEQGWFKKFTNRFNISGTNLKTVDQKSASAFIWITVITIVLLLFFQIYWITGNSLLIPKPKRQLVEFDSLISQEITLNHNWRHAWESLRLEHLKYEKGANPYQGQDTLLYERKRLRSLAGLDSLQKLSQTVYLQRTNLTKEIRHQYANILDWNKVWETLTLITVFRAFGNKEEKTPEVKNPPKEKSDKPKSEKAVSHADTSHKKPDSAATTLDSNTHSSRAEEQDLNISFPVQRIEVAPKVSLNKHRDSLKLWMDKLLPIRTNYIHGTNYARNALTSFQSFILPLLYGILGALLFILRKYKSGLKASSSLNATNYLIRIVMGGLAGLAIGWFVSIDGSDTPFKIGNLSPLALSFLAGYGVEILFTGLDSLVSKFSSSNGQGGGA